MNNCMQCGNQYDKTFTIIQDEKSYLFDCFECAIQFLAPSCQHCRTKIIGHGVEVKNKFYCCAHCARVSGEKTTLVDRDS